MKTWQEHVRRAYLLVEQTAYDVSMHDVAVAFESIEEAKRDLVAAMKLADDYLVHQLDECYDVLVRIAAWLESYGFESVDRQNTRREAIARACVLAQKDLENIFPDLRAQ